MVSGNRNEEILKTLIDNIDREKMADNLMMIYLLKIKDNQKNLLLNKKKKKSNKLLDKNKKDNSQKIKHNNIEDFNKFQYGLTLSGGYNTWNIHLYYSLAPLLKGSALLDNQAIKFRPLRVGVVFYIL